MFRGTLRQLSYRTGMAAYLSAASVLLKDFASHAEGLTRRLREASEAAARQAGRPIRHLASSATNKARIARGIAGADGITQELAPVKAGLVHHGLTTFLSQDVMRFLGRNIPPTANVPPRLRAEVVSDIKARPEGVRIKHRLGDNSIKMYDKAGSVLRVETTINHAAGFKSYRSPEGKPDAPKAWHPMAKGIAELHRRTEVSQASNPRHLQALGSVEDTTAQVRTIVTALIAARNTNTQERAKLAA